ncbi:MAG: hypothetical protein A3H57_01945 [Candidatus Taylorbacteria bacterium RIFCSPLOWO2_02_FULL_43_11]|uniref:Ribonuclease n=1 Tax=Candidatus Taylorbacteria bacterium RIFCSPHIGHO2_02_FULL_43_32b TaxID=1802306 RepID=A0A1G2MHH8_9BACT|nr:MAG: hypothetical protein A2743_04535 [Candidatus Taylorbacteria bacterium RIFCSPHIGHO2_01_FULL_43_47]OHA22629.1 MAG: hypothetical protein A3C72_03105 [Candidatus Taylorbacteria bacterium RIFCSPHIGHO2_02_FULL_43_32b]OHA29589.1 MAG: hypothetical protein A3B08_02350 [Candidatus Taylorbacteria bacterium RIFCSPLOWO2_01_FULL_43_44]OHA36318.1 MAG: hypothetical protein A3H57_01945 [Candidatus Taylorbacteria bacterium RIFCSPLOWO2_02_FULL_43_11]
MKWLVGIDEVGRGPLAGPVCIGLCVIPDTKSSLLWRTIKGARDSKQLTSTERNFWYGEAKKIALCGELFFYTSMVSSAYIDKYGLSPAIKLAVKKSFYKSKLKPDECRVLLDGSLYAPSEFKNQTTIIRGDATEPIISLASIIAKVRRDNLMNKLAKKYPLYGFESNKGYGTKDHIKALQIHGPCPIHRASYIRNILSAL